MPRKKPTHVDDPVAAGRRLKEARERAGLSQRDLAFPGCSPAYLSRIEAGARVASPPLLRELARRLGISEEHLARGVDGRGLVSELEEAEIMLRLGETDEAARIFENVSGETDSREERSRALEGLAKIAVQGDELESAVELFEEALSLAGDDLTERPDLAEGLAGVYLSLGRTARAISILERCLAWYAEEPVQYVRFAGLLGIALMENGSVEDAERVLADALGRGRELAAPQTRARVYWSAFRLRREQGDVEQAVSLTERTKEILRAAEDMKAVARLHCALAQVHMEQSRPEEALELLREGRILVQAAGTEAEIAASRIEEARALAALDQKEQAAALALEVSAALEGADGVEFGRAYAALGGLLGELGETERGRVFLQQAITLLEGRGSGRYLVCAYKRLAELLLREGDAAGALEVLERSLGVQGTTLHARSALARGTKNRN